MTKVDKMCQDTIKSIILRDFPNHNFLGEEDISPGIDAAEEALKQNQMLQPGCALDILQKADVIELENGFEKQIERELFPSTEDSQSGDYE